MSFIFPGIFPGVTWKACQSTSIEYGACSFCMQYYETCSVGKGYWGSRTVCCSRTIEPGLIQKMRGAKRRSALLSFQDSPCRGESLKASKNPRHASLNYSRTQEKPPT